MNDDIEMDNNQTEISTPVTYRLRKKRAFVETITNLSEQLNQMCFHKKKFRIDSENHYILETSDEKKEETEAKTEIDDESEKISDSHKPVIDMKLEREMVSDYYKKQNSRLNKLMFGPDDDNDNENKETGDFSLNAINYFTHK